MRFEGQKTTILMVMLQIMQALLTLSTKASLLEGMNPRIFVVYRQTIATLLIAPLPFLSRKPHNDHLTWKSFGLIFLISLIGVTINQNIFFEGLYLASSSMASALSNVLPAITFIVAYIVGMEKIKARNVRSFAKIAGTIICVAGAIGMVMIKGPKLLNKEFDPPKNVVFSSKIGDESGWFLGCVLLFLANICWSIWLILQVPISVLYPHHLSQAGWTCFLSALQCASYAFFMDQDLHTWKLHSYKQFFSCSYAGFVSAVAYLTQAWCISRRGPLFSAMFNPLGTVLVTIFAAILLHEEMFIGSLIGAIAVIFGLYIVLWGKAKDQEIKPYTRQEEQNEEGKLYQEFKDDNNSCKINFQEPFLP